MMAEGNQNQSPVEAMSQFWTDMFSRMGGGAFPGGSTPGMPNADVAKQMQKAFFENMAKYCDEYMRSEQFLQMMKQSMDRSLAFKQQMDQFLNQCYASSMAPSRTDVTDLAGLMRSVEERILARLNQLEDRVAAVEDADGSERSAGASRAQRPSVRGDSRTKGKNNS
jgi:hypothetical protein